MVNRTVKIFCLWEGLFFPCFQPGIFRLVLWLMKLVRISTGYPVQQVDWPAHCAPLQLHRVALLIFFPVTP
jgi:hypothetical protein